jgi:NADH-quinone oxidoreductase subunit J
MEVLNAVLFYTLAALTGVSALAVVISQNIVRAATWLLFTLAGAAGIFFLLGAEFIGATQLLVYVGGTLVLVVFGVMLTAQGPFINMKISAAEWAVAVFVGAMLYAVLTFSLLSMPDPATGVPVLAVGHKHADGEGHAKEHKGEKHEHDHDRPKGEAEKKGADKAPEAQAEGAAQPATPKPPRPLTPSKYLGAALLGDERVTPIAELTGMPAGAPKISRTRVSYLLPFEIVSVHLLVVLIGAAYLARAKRRQPSGRDEA